MIIARDSIQKSKDGILKLSVRTDFLLTVSIVTFILLIRFIHGLLLVHTHVDFLVYRYGTVQFFSGNKLYELMPILGPGHVWLPFLYPPMAAVFFWPITLVSPSVGATIFTIINIILPIGIAYCVVTRLKIFKLWENFYRSYRSDKLGTYAALGVIFLFTEYIWPIYGNSLFGQVNVMLEGLVILDLYLFFTSPKKCGYLSGIAAAIKITPLPIIIFYALAKKWNICLKIIGTFGFISFVGWIISPSNTLEFINKLILHTDNAIGITFGLNVGINGILTRFIRDEQVSRILWLTLSLIVFLIAIFVMRLLLKKNEVFISAIIIMMTTLIISPISWSYHWTYIGIFIPILVNFYYKYPSRFGMLLTAITAIVFFSQIEKSLPLGHAKEKHWLWWQHALDSSYTVIIVIVFIHIGYTLIASSRKDKITSSVLPPLSNNPLSHETTQLSPIKL